MTEYELSEVVIGYTSNIDQSTAVMISVLSAYLVVAYTIGAKLTRFQAAFISAGFIMVFAGILSAQYFYMTELLYATDQLQSVKDFENHISKASGNVIVLVFYAVRLLFLSGALYFMWNVRHPKL